MGLRWGGESPKDGFDAGGEAAARAGGDEDLEKRWFTLSEGEAFGTGGAEGIGHLAGLPVCYAVPGVLAAAAWLIAGGMPPPLWLVWPAHIAFDRALGYGLKSEAGFRHTHLGELG